MATCCKLECGGYSNDWPPFTIWKYTEVKNQQANLEALKQGTKTEDHVAVTCCNSVATNDLRSPSGDLRPTYSKHLTNAHPRGIGGNGVVVLQIRANGVPLPFKVKTELQF